MNTLIERGGVRKWRESLRGLASWCREWWASEELVSSLGKIKPGTERPRSIMQVIERFREQAEKRGLRMEGIVRHVVWDYGSPPRFRMATENEAMAGFKIFIAKQDSLLLNKGNNLIWQERQEMLEKSVKEGCNREYVGESAEVFERILPVF